MKRFLRLAAVLFAGFLFGWLPGTTSEKFAIGVESAVWMPPGATDGAYYSGETLIIIGPPARYYEFSISEADFRRFLEDRKKVATEISEPLYVQRYLSELIRRDDFRKDGDHDRNAYEAAIGVTIADGLVWKRDFEDEQYIYAFDRSQNRAFIQLNYR